jgi:hypothetical protein
MTKNTFRNVSGITIVLLVKEDIDIVINDTNDMIRLREQIPSEYLPIIDKLVMKNLNFNTEPSRLRIIGHTDDNKDTPYVFRPGECIPYVFGLYPMDVDNIITAKKRFDCDVSLKYTQFVSN